MKYLDFFNFFRYALGTVVSIYAGVVTLQSLYSWYIYFSGEGKYYSLARRYLMLHGLRLRIKTFGGDVLICILLTILFFMLWHAHHLVALIDPYPTHAGRIATIR